MRIVIFIFFGLILLNIISLVLALLSSNHDEETGHDAGTVSAVTFLLSLLIIWILGIVIFAFYIR